jgi:hypothetical protein
MSSWGKVKLQGLQEFQEFGLLLFVRQGQSLLLLFLVVGLLLHHTVHNEWIWFFRVLNIENGLGLFSLQLFPSAAHDVPTHDNKDGQHKNHLVE